jgi:hypothetical protein
MEINNNLHNSPCSTQNRGRPRNYLFVYCVSSAHLGGDDLRELQVGLPEKFWRETESIQGRAERNRTAQEKGGEGTGGKGVGRKECCSI